MNTLNQLTHHKKDDKSTLCGGYYPNGRMLVLSFLDQVPTCRTCREAMEAGAKIHPTHYRDFKKQNP